jgi:FkbM family methyltransferase
MMTLPPVSAVLQNIGINRGRVGYPSALADPGDERLLKLRLRNGRTVTLCGPVRPSLNEVLLHKIYDVPGVVFRQCRQVFDLGADMGVFAIYVASQAPAATITCIEASSAGFPLLQRNLANNTDRAHAYRMVITAQDERTRLPSMVNGAREYWPNGAVDDGSGATPRTSLANLFAITGAETCDFLKMDIGGEEKAILLETPFDVLRQVRVMSMRWNYAEEELPRVRLRLAAAGFGTTVDYAGYRGSQVMLKAWQL